MKRKLLILVVCILTLGLSGIASAVTDYFWTGLDGGDWNDPNNWDLGQVPSGDQGDQERGLFTAAGGPLIDSTDVVASWITEMLAGVIVFDGGTWNGTQFEVGVVSGLPATVVMNDGVINTGNLFIGLITFGHGTVDVYDGQINCDAWLGLAWSGDSESGYLNLYGGTVTATLFDIADNGNRSNFTYDPSKAKVDIYEGVLHIGGDRTSDINAWVTNGNIVGYEKDHGGGTVIWDFDETLAGYTTVQAVQNYPIPSDGEVDVPWNTNLEWAPASNCPGDSPIITYDVYLGTVSTPPLVSSGQTATVYNPPTDLDFNQLYYWRIDYYDCNDVLHTSPEWSFTTSSPKAIVVSPTIDETGVDPNVILEWIVASGTESHDVYLGLTPGTLVFQDSLSAGETTFDPDPDLEWGTDYFWRIDETIGGTLYIGDVWNFTTYVLICDPPLLGDANGDCVVNLLDFAIIAPEWLDCNWDRQEACP